MPKPSAGHQKVEKIAGQWAGEERVAECALRKR